MATTAYNTAEEIFPKEDVSEVISNIDPTETSFISQIGTEKAIQPHYNWMEEKLNAVGVNAQTEGFEAADEVVLHPTPRGNVTQIFAKVIRVTGSNEAEALHGRPSQMAHQMVKAGKEIKRDLEYASIGTKQTKVDGLTRQFDGVQAQTPLVFGTGSATTPITSAVVDTAHQQLRVNGAKPTTLLVGYPDGQSVAAFARGNAQQNRVLNDGMKTVTNAVTLYVSPYGELGVSLNLWIAPGDSLLFDREMYKLVVYRNWFTKELPEGGDYYRKMLVGEFGLKHLNQAASAIIRRQ